MNQPLFTFDARTVAPAMGFENWPGGWYPLMIRKSNLKKTQDEKGGYLELTIEAIDGPMKGQTNWIRLNLRNENTITVEMAQKTLSAICHVTGVYNVQAFDVTDNAVPMLHNIPFQGLCVISVNKETKREGNNWNGFKDMQGNQPGKSSGAPMNQPPPNMPPPPPPPPPNQPANNWGGAGGQQTAQPASWQQPGPNAAPAAPANNWGGQQNAPAAPAPNQPPQWQQSPSGGNAGGPWNK